MLRSGAVLAAGVLVAGLAAVSGPAAADDDAGTSQGGLWGEVDESSSAENNGTDNSGTDNNGTDSNGTDSTDSSGSGDGGGGGGGDGCAESLALTVTDLGNCGYVPLEGEPEESGEPEAPPVVDARDQAESAYERLSLATANVRIAPSPPLPTYPNLETWIWVPRSQWQPLTLDVTAGSTTVHVEARPVRVDIDAGEREAMKYSSAPIDSTFSCSGPGRAWDESLGDDAETSCGYTYQTTSSNNPSGSDHYELTAAIVYEASWTCVGQCSEDGGSLGETSGPTGSQPVVVQERQSVVVD